MAKPRKKKGGPKGITIEQYAEALEATGCILTDAAEILGVTISTVAQRIGNSPRLQEIKEKHLKHTINIAESQLMRLIKEGNPASVFFYLKCKGDYSEKQRIEGEIKLTHENWLDKLHEEKE